MFKRLLHFPALLDNKDTVTKSPPIPLLLPKSLVTKSRRSGEDIEECCVMRLHKRSNILGERWRRQGNVSKISNHRNFELSNVRSHTFPKQGQIADNAKLKVGHRYHKIM